MFVEEAPQPTRTGDLRSPAHREAERLGERIAKGAAEMNAATRALARARP